MELSTILSAAIAFVLFHFWWKTIRAREHAGKYAVLACSKENVQFLDSTVSFARIGIEKAKNGDRFLLRYFNFDFSSDGTDRRRGIIALYGTRQFLLFMDLPEHPTITETCGTTGNAL